MSEMQTWCGYCGRDGVELSTWNQGATSTLLCTKCVAKKEETAALAQQIIAGTAPTTTPDFGDHCEAAVKLACAMFPPTFRLRGHEGTFRVSERASYVSRGRVMVYTQRLRTYTLPAGVDSAEERREFWDDFAKGTIAELKAQIVGGV